MTNGSRAESVNVTVRTVARVSVRKDGGYFFACVLAGDAGDRGIAFRAKDRDAAIKAALRSVGMSAIK